MLIVIWPYDGPGAARKTVWPTCTAVLGLLGRGTACVSAKWPKSRYGPTAPGGGAKFSGDQEAKKIKKKIKKELKIKGLKKFW